MAKRKNLWYIFDAAKSGDLVGFRKLAHKAVGLVNKNGHFPIEVVFRYKQDRLIDWMIKNNFYTNYLLYYSTKYDRADCLGCLMRQICEKNDDYVAEILPLDIMGDLYLSYTIMRVLVYISKKNSIDVEIVSRFLYMYRDYLHDDKIIMNKFVVKFIQNRRLVMNDKSLEILIIMSSFGAKIVMPRSLLPRIASVLVSNMLCLGLPRETILEILSLHSLLKQAAIITMDNWIPLAVFV